MRNRVGAKTKLKPASHYLITFKGQYTRIKTKVKSSQMESAQFLILRKITAKLHKKLLSECLYFEICVCLLVIMYPHFVDKFDHSHQVTLSKLV